jgi:hypothetical protein
MGSKMLQQAQRVLRWRSQLNKCLNQSRRRQSAESAFDQNMGLESALEAGKLRR